MKYDPAKHHRHSTRLREYDYSSPGNYFLTICTDRRQCLFGEIVDGVMELSEFGQIVAEEWERSPILRPNLELDVWVVMPNHFHGIIRIIDTVGTNYERAQCIAPLTLPIVHTNKLHRKPQSLGSFVAGFKTAVTKRINAIRETPGVPVWQRNYYDHIIRNKAVLHRIRQYITNNPQSWHSDRLHPDNPS